MQEAMKEVIGWVALGVSFVGGLGGVRWYLGRCELHSARVRRERQSMREWAERMGACHRPRSVFDRGGRLRVTR